MSVSLEKVQVAAMADRLGRLLVELDERGIVELEPTLPVEDVGPLDEPLSEAFRAGTLTLGWDGDLGRVIIEAQAMTEADEVESDDDDEIDDDASMAAVIEQMLTADDVDGPDILRVHLSATQARSFVERANRVVRSGRLPCPLCGNPLDPQGHICPRRNGQYVN